MKTFVASLACALCMACATRAPSTAAPDPPRGEASAPEAGGRTRLELRIVPLVDHYFQVRARAAAVDVAPTPDEAAAVEAARALQRALGSFGGWGPLDTQVFVAADASELVRAFAALPEPYERRGRTISIRDDAVRLATAMESRTPEFMRDEWPARAAALDRRLADLEANFMPRHREALAFMLQSLGIPDPTITVPVFLVTATNPPGAMTYFLRGGAPVSVVDVDVGGTGALLYETILHESCHALDLASRNSDDAFSTLRTLLEQRGLSQADEAWHAVPHTLMFVQAAETMRRLFDPDHVAYGAATDLYRRTGVTADVEREIWPRYLDGELTRDEALRRIVDALYPP